MNSDLWHDIYGAFSLSCSYSSCVVVLLVVSNFLKQKCKSFVTSFLENKYIYFIMHPFFGTTSSSCSALCLLIYIMKWQSLCANKCNFLTTQPSIKTTHQPPTPRDMTGRVTNRATTSICCSYPLRMPWYSSTIYLNTPIYSLGDCRRSHEASFSVALSLMDH